MKGLSQQTIRAASPMNTAGSSLQLLSSLQRPRPLPIATTSFNPKQIATRGITQSQRNFQLSSMKLGSQLAGKFFLWYYMQCNPNLTGFV